MVTAIVIAFCLLNAVLLYNVYPSLYKQNPVAKTIDIVKQAPAVFAYKIYNPGYNFYLDKNVKRYQSLDSLNTQMKQNPAAVVISRKEFADSLQLLNLDVISEHHDLFELPTTVILKPHATP